MPGNKARSSYKKKGKVFMVSDLRRDNVSSAKKKACVYQINTSRAGLKECLNLYCHNCGYKKKLSTSCCYESKDTALVSTNVRDCRQITE